jgi:neurotransmitter:Na+ symporter, NSS family
VLGIVMPLVVFTYYTVIIGWLLGFAFFSLTGGYFFPGLEAAEAAGQVRDYLTSMQDIGDTSMHGGWVGFLFYAITLGAIVWVLARGSRGGSRSWRSSACRCSSSSPSSWRCGCSPSRGRRRAIPCRVSPSSGRRNGGGWGTRTSGWPRRGQVFFTLSLGMGTLHTYASFLSKDDDIMLTGLATASTNEFAEVVLGGTIAIPAAVTSSGWRRHCHRGHLRPRHRGDGRGLPGAPRAGAGREDRRLHVVLPALHRRDHILGALASPAIAFMQEEFGVQRTRAVLGLGAFTLLLGLLNIVLYQGGFLDEWDYWAGTFGLVVFAFIEIWIVRLVFGMDAFWEEMHSGADIRVPRIFLFTLKWITPAFVTVLLGWWAATEAIPILFMEGIDPDQYTVRWIARLTMVAMLVTGIYLIRRAWRNKRVVAATAPRDSEVRR